ncbi:MAG: hypothetical protein ACT4O1_01160 [Gemmatimonadota bacterium]
MVSRGITLAVVLALGLAAETAAREGATTGEPSATMVALDSIASPAKPGSGEPDLAIGSNGRVYMSWLEPQDSGHALRFAVLQNNRWSAPRTIRSGRDFFVNWADFPSIIVLGDGQLAAHWLQRTGRGTYAYGVRIAQSRDDGRTWSAPIIPHRDSSQTEHGFVALWRERGTLGAAWLDGRKFAVEGHNAANEMMLLATTVDANGALGPETRLDERTCDCCQNSAAVTAAGPVVVYRDRSNDEIRDIFITRRVDGKWTPGAAVHNDNWKIAACPVNGPAVAASGNRVAVAWFTAANDNQHVKVAFSNTAGASFAPPIRLDGGNPAGRVHIALLRNGDALVTWIERTGGDAATVRARRVSPNGKLGRSVTVATSSAARASGFPRMAVTESEVTFAWTVPGKPSHIRVARAALKDFR